MCDSDKKHYENAIDVLQKERDDFRSKMLEAQEQVRNLEDNLRIQRKKCDYYKDEEEKTRKHNNTTVAVMTALVVFAAAVCGLSGYYGCQKDMRKAMVDNEVGYYDGKTGEFKIVDLKAKK